MPLRPKILKNKFEEAFNHKMERLMNSQEFDEYKRANEQLADALVNAIETYIREADVDHTDRLEVDTNVKTQVETAVKTQVVTTVAGTVGTQVDAPGIGIHEDSPGIGEGTTRLKKKIGKIT